MDSGSFAEFEFSGIVIGALYSYLNKSGLSLREREWLDKFIRAILEKRMLLGSYQEIYRYTINDWLDPYYENLFKPLIELPEFIKLPEFETLKSKRWFLRDLLNFLLYRYLHQAKSLSCPLSPRTRKSLDVLEKDPLVSESFHSYFEGMKRLYLASLISHLGSPARKLWETDHSKLISKGEEIMLKEFGFPAPEKPASKMPIAKAPESKSPGSHPPDTSQPGVLQFASSKDLLPQKRVVPKRRPDSGTAATGDLSGSRTDVSDLSEGSSEKPDSNSKKGTDPSPEKPGTGGSGPSDGMGMGKILGISFAVIAVVIAACGAVFFLRQRRSKADR